MHRHQRNHIALALAVAAILAGLASAAPLGAPLAPLLGLLAYATLAASLHTVHPRPEGTEEEDPPETWANVVASVSMVLVLLTSVLIAAAALARVAEVTYLGPVPLFLAENFTIITGPLAAFLALGPVLAARGHLTLAAPPAPARRVASLLLYAGALVLSGLIALEVGLPTEAWHASYPLAIAGIVAWLDALHLAGLPTPARMAASLERGETAESRLLLRTMAITGNAVVILLALAAGGLHIMAYTATAVLVELLAIALLLATTYAASTLRNTLPAELEEEPGQARREEGAMRLLALAPLFTVLFGGLLTVIAVAGTLAGPGGLSDAAELVRPALGGLVAVLAGINLARARMRPHQDPSPVRRATWTVASAVLAGTAFFALIINADMMSGPVVASGIGLVFEYATLMAVGLFVLARGLYPMPWSGLKKEVEEAKERPEEYKETLERNLLVVYVASGAFLLAAMGLLAAITLGGLNVPVPESTAGRNAAFLTLVALGIVLILGLVALFMQSRKLSAPEQKQGVNFKKRYTPDQVARLAILGLSGTIAFLLAFLGVLVMMGQLTSVGALELEERHSTDFFVFAILLGMGPAGFLYNRERKRIKAIDKQLPEFLRDLAESQRTGMTLTQAVITAAKGNYGAMTEEVRKMAAQIEWGVSFEDALLSFAKRVDTPLVQRTVTLIIEAQSSGGNVIDVLSAASEDAREIQMIEQERKNGMQIYVMIIYIAFLVFLGVIAILNVKFMPEVAKAVAGASGVTVGSITFTEFDIQSFRTLFFHAAVIQGLGGGFVAGSMEEGKPVAGLKHAFIMVIVAYVLFRFVLGG